ncbi:OsmC family peroxiredoxin [Nocardiopsis sp. MG754419]|uniref:OsmC family peroxiredoxin n=1 Tax=Nocardiopsis sp. MG754419 TaxID=2259865 RepID=UPI001BABC32A|nr:OsmC family peroxiredoxin [Nocardiopsis sp. MG754419]MBR8742857.1 peroxiredoxin [Nocardiopsis sp. MG754419]
MATTRSATANWQGALLDGHGQVSLDSSGVGSFDVTWASRAESPEGRTSPEELIGAAHATCFSMALSHGLAGGGTPPQRLETNASVTFEPGKGITGVHLKVRAHVAGLTEEQFQRAAEDAKENCPVSQALTGTTITLEAHLA